MTAVPPAGALARLVARRAADPASRDGVFLEAARDARCLGYAQLPALLVQWAQALERWDVAPGARVLVRTSDPLTTAGALLGIAAAGRVAVPVDPRAPEADVARSRRVAGAVATVADPSTAELGTARGAADEHVVPLLDPETLDALDPDLADLAELDGAGDDTGLTDDPAATDDAGAPGPAGAFALATSGSTGAPKLVQLDEQRLVYVATMVAQHNGLSPADRGYNPLPLFHVNAEVVALLATLVAGATLVLDARFRRTGFFELVREREVTWINGVPTIWSILAGDPPPEPLPALRFVRSASAPLPGAVRGWVADGLGVPVVESYGMTEAASQITATPLSGAVPPGSVGRGVGTDVQVRVGASPAPAGERGRVWIRGPGVVTSYADTPDAPASRYADRFDAAGWLDTGDLGRLDEDGFLTLDGRADDVINRGGELVHPREVEEVLHRDRRIRDAVVVGRPDPVLGEVPVAYLVLRPEAREQADDVVAGAVKRCTEQLSGFKRPVEVLVVDDLPRASTGKIKRREVGR